jgi:hypothetical protein
MSQEIKCVIKPANKQGAFILCVCVCAPTEARNLSKNKMLVKSKKNCQIVVGSFSPSNKFSVINNHIKKLLKVELSATDERKFRLIASYSAFKAFSSANG